MVPLQVVEVVREPQPLLGRREPRLRRAGAIELEHDVPRPHRQGGDEGEHECEERMRERDPARCLQDQARALDDPEPRQEGRGDDDGPPADAATPPQEEQEHRQQGRAEDERGRRGADQERSRDPRQERPRSRPRHTEPSVVVVGGAGALAAVPDQQDGGRDEREHRAHREQDDPHRLVGTRRHQRQRPDQERPEEEEQHRGDRVPRGDRHATGERGSGRPAGRGHTATVRP